MDKQNTALPHKLTLDQRSKLAITGVCEVIRFDESTVELRTALGTLMIHGSDLQLKTLSVEGGQVAVEGSVAALIYEEPRNTGGWLSRLLG